MDRIANFIIRFRWPVIVVIAILTVFFGWQATKIAINADFSTYLNQTDPLVKEYNRVGDVFGGKEMGYALVTTDNVYTPYNLRLIKDLTEAYSSVEGLVYAISLSNTIDFRKTDWGLEVGELLEESEMPETAQQLDAFRSRVEQNDRYVGNLVSEDGTAAVIMLKFAGKASQFSTALRAKAATDAVLQSAGFASDTAVYFGGMPFLIYNTTLLISDNISVLVPIMLLVLVSVLFIAFRHWAGVVFPLMVVGVTVVWMLGLASMHGMELTILTSFVPVVLMALGSADAIHLLKAYFEHRRAGGTPAEASRGVYRQMGVPIVLTTITTGIGFSSLVFTKFSIIKQFGMLAASGVIIALIVTLTLLPALLSFGITVKPAPQRTRSRKPLMDRFGGMVYRSKFVPVIAGVLVVIVSALSVPRIVKDVDWSLCLKKGSGPFHAEMLLREKFGGSLPIQVLVQGDLKDPAVLNLLRAVERRLEVTPTVHKSLSVAAVIAEMNDAINDRYAIPQNRQGVANLWILTEGEEEIQMIVADGQQEALINAKLGTWETEPLVKAVASVDAHLSGLPEKLTVVDLSQAPPAARIEILKLKGQQIAQELSWDLQKYGLSLGNDDLLRVVEAASTVRADSQLRDRVRLAVEAYLRSPEAEVVLAEADIQPVAVSIAENLDESLVPDASQITESLYMADRAMHPEDASFLAESLQRVVEASIGEARIAFAMQRLQEMMPGLLTKGQNLLRDIRGTLWQVNEGLAYVDSAVAVDLLSENSAAVLRDVDLKLSQTGLAPVLKRMEEELIPTQVASLMITVVFVIILLSFIFRTAIGGLLAVIPIILTVLVNFSVMVYLDIGLDSFTAMIASIAIGLGIDYAIHFLSRLRDELRVDGNELAALKRTANTTGVAIIVNGLAVGLGFAVLLFAGGQHLRRFGGLTSLTMVVSGLFTLTVLPSLFLLLKPAFIKRAIAQGMESERAGTIESALKPPVQTEVLQRG